MKQAISFFQFIVLLILSIGVLSSFILTFRSLGKLDFLSVRVDRLEKRPVELPSEGDNLIVEQGRLGSPSSNPTPTITPTQPQTATSSAKLLPTPTSSPSALVNQSVSYLPIFGSFTTVSTAWVDVPKSDFILNKKEIEKADVYWEALAQVSAGSGEVRLRLYDRTNNIVVMGSEIATNAGETALISSGKLTLWNGVNTYRVQIMSKISTEAKFEGGRVKIVNKF